jgi:hypothetical protein
MTALRHLHSPARDGSADVRTSSPDWAGIAATLLADLPPAAPNASHDDPPDGTSPSDVVYRGWWRPNGHAAVVIEDPPGTYRALPHLIRHSPAGMAWGYDGNGPRDLARSLLADTLGKHATCPSCTRPSTPPNGTRPSQNGSGHAVAPTVGQFTDCPNHCDAGVLPLPHLDFTEHVIAHLPQEHAWSLRRTDILRWLMSPQHWPPQPSGFSDPPLPAAALRCGTPARSRHTRQARSHSQGRRP